MTENSNDIYIGSTVQTLTKRLGQHETHFRTGRYCSSAEIIKQGDYKIVLIKNFACNSLLELETEETKFQKDMVCVNKKLARITEEERKQCNKQYKIDNKEAIKQYHKQYNIDNKEAIKQYNKQYNIDNKEGIKQYYIDNKEEIKQYKIDNKESIKQYKKQYYIDNKESIKQKKKQYRERKKQEKLNLKKQRIIFKIKKTIN